MNSRLRFNVRALLVLQAWLACAIAALLLGLARLSDAFGLLLGVLTLAPLVGAGFATLCKLHGKPREVVAILFSVAVGIAAVVFIAFQFEWRGDGPDKGHPWPQSDEFFIALAALRGALLGGVVGYIVLKTLSLAAKAIDRPSQNESRRKLTGATFLLIAVALLVVTWWPYWSFHMEERAAKNLLVAIEAGNSAELPAYVASVKKYGKGTVAVGVVSFRAVHGTTDDSRKAAMEALKLLGTTATSSPLLVLVLQEMKQRETNNDLRAAANRWLEELQPAPGELAPK